MNTQTGIKKWHELDGDNTLALDWPLNEESHVWEIGGFEGRWAQQIWDKFHCNITIFEPQDWAVAKMRNRFGEMDKIQIRPYGLWVEDGVFPIGNFFTDGATMIPSGLHEPTAKGVFKNYYTELFYDTKHRIDLALMNIEGAEYTLIPEFVESGVITKFDYFFCQFHTQFSNPRIVEPEKESVFIDQYYFNLMGETHYILWNCYPTAVAWKKR